MNLFRSYKIWIHNFLTWLEHREKEWERRPLLHSAHKFAGEIHPVFGRYFWKTLEIGVICIFLLIALYGFAWRAPEPFPDHILVRVDAGEHLGAIAEKFKREGVINSSFWLKVFVTLRGGERRVIAGDYYLPTARNLLDVSRMITHGEYGLSPIRISIPEGLNSYEMAELLSQSLPRFDKDEFLDKARTYEGFLFPDTYFFMPNQSPESIVATMRENFARQVNDLVREMEQFGKTLDEIVTMASIVEDEARQLETRRVVAGILWKRLRLDMPLQADATFKYYNGKTSFDLTKEDLADKDNPYNTYANKGLPPTPISNPGLDSIRAAIAPTNTDYLYFLSDSNGIMHYAIDFEGHKRNRELYLR